MTGTMSDSLLSRQPKPLDFVSRTYSGLAMVLMVPVSITIFMVVWGVQELTPIYAGKNQSPLFLASSESASQSDSEKLGSSLLNALIIIAMITVVTFIMVGLYKAGCMKVIYAWFGFSAVLIFFFLMWIWIDLCATRYQVPYDYVTIALILWNFGIVGLIALFYYCHPRMAQFYLVVISVIMAWMLARLPEWTTWTILVGVALYDIVAVLCPKGPLQLLLKTAHEKGEPIPGFIYDSATSGLTTMGKEGDKGKKTVAEKRAEKKSEREKTTRIDEKDKREESQRPAFSVSASPTASPTPSPSASTNVKVNPLMDESYRHDTTRDMDEEESSDTMRTEAAPATPEKNPEKTMSKEDSPKKKYTPKEIVDSYDAEKRATVLARVKLSELEGYPELIEEAKRRRAELQEELKREDEEDDNPWEVAGDQTPFKLGLGDFIFYSLLVARAAMFSYVSWMVCYVAVLMGLIGTLSSLLFLRGKVPALPALPISIFLAVLVYFTSRYLLVPYVYYISSTGYGY